MIDSLAILLSCGALAYVAWRASVLDRIVPWFSRAEAPPPALEPPPQRRVWPRTRTRPLPRTATARPRS